MFGIRVDQPHLHTIANGPRPGTPDRVGPHDRDGTTIGAGLREFPASPQPFHSDLEEDRDGRSGQDRHEHQDREDLRGDQPTLEPDAGHDDLHGATAVHGTTGDQAFTPAVAGRQVDEGSPEDLAEGGSRHDRHDQHPVLQGG